MIKKGVPQLLIFATNIVLEDNDEEFINNLYHNYYGIVAKKISFMLFDEIRNQMNDIIQDVFIHLIKHIPTLKALDVTKRTAYIVKAARNATLNYIKKYLNEKQKCSLGQEDDISCALENGNRDFHPEETLLQVERMEGLGKAMSTLSISDQQILYYYLIGGFSCKEISRILHLNENATRQRVFQARKRAMKAIEKQKKEVEKNVK